MWGIFSYDNKLGKLTGCVVMYNALNIHPFKTIFNGMINLSVKIHTQLMHESFPQYSVDKVLRKQPLMGNSLMEKKCWSKSILELCTHNQQNFVPGFDYLDNSSMFTNLYIGLHIENYDNYNYLEVKTCCHFVNLW